MRRILSPQERGFTFRDGQRLAQAFKQAQQARVCRRIQAVLLVAQGHSFLESSQITALRPRTVYNLVSRYLQKHQIQSLHDLPRSGRPMQASQLQSADILKELKRSPLELGYRTNVWTVKTLADHLNDIYHCSIAPWTLRRRMKEMDLVFKRPRYVFSEKDPHRAQKKGLSSAS